jgi:cell division protein FtsX
MSHSANPIPATVIVAVTIAAFVSDLIQQHVADIDGIATVRAGGSLRTYLDPADGAAFTISIEEVCP